MQWKAERVTGINPRVMQTAAVSHATEMHVVKILILVLEEWGQEQFAGKETCWKSLWLRQ